MTTFQIEVIAVWEVCKAKKPEKLFQEQKTPILTSGTEKTVFKHSHCDLVLPLHLVHLAPHLLLHHQPASQGDP